MGLNTQKYIKGSFRWAYEQAKQGKKADLDALRLTHEEWNFVRCPSCGRVINFRKCKRRHIIYHPRRTD